VRAASLPIWHARGTRSTPCASCTPARSLPSALVRPDLRIWGPSFKLVPRWSEATSTSSAPHLAPLPRHLSNRLERVGLGIGAGEAACREQQW
jgi:hypothetical protein